MLAAYFLRSSTGVHYFKRTRWSPGNDVLSASSFSRYHQTHHLKDTSRSPLQVNDETKLTSWRQWWESGCSTKSLRPHERSKYYSWIQGHGWSIPGMEKMNKSQNVSWSMVSFSVYWLLRLAFLHVDRQSTRDESIKFKNMRTLRARTGRLLMIFLPSIFNVWIGDLYAFSRKVSEQFSFRPSADKDLD